MGAFCVNILLPAQPVAAGCIYGGFVKFQSTGVLGVLAAAMMLTAIPAAASETSPATAPRQSALYPGLPANSRSLLGSLAGRNPAAARPSALTRLAALVGGRSLPGHHKAQTSRRTVGARATSTYALNATATAPTSQPVITSPSAGAIASDAVTVTATSSAATVRFTMPTVQASLDAPVVNGVATAQLPTYGAVGAQTLTAADCDNTGACGTPTTLEVTVNNTPPTLTAPTAGSVVNSEVTAKATGVGGSVGFLLAGSVAAVDTTAPYEAALNTGGLANGQYQVAAVTCNAAGTVCATTQPGPAVTITVNNELTPAITAITPSTFSPGTDGRQDTTKISYTLNVTQAVTWSVLDSNHATVVEPHSLGTLSAGAHSLTFAGRDDTGAYLPSGSYTISLDTTAGPDGSTLTGHDQAPFTIDRTAPRASSISASPTTFYPVKDGYKDHTVLSVRTSEPLDYIAALVTNQAGRTVAAGDAHNVNASRITFTWNGTNPRRTLVPAGTYYYQWVLRDRAGNTTVTGKRKVVVSDKRLLKRTGTKTVTAAGSFVLNLSGACSELFSPGVRNWAGSVGYYSNYDDCAYYTDSTDDLAAAEHAAWLPKAVKYGSVRINTYGGRALNKYKDHAALLYYTGAGDVTSTGKVLGPAVGWWNGPSAGARFISKTGRVKWAVATQNVNLYDVKKFTLHYTDWVLG